MEMDVMTITICCILFAAAVITSLRNGFFRIPKDNGDENAPDCQAPQLSVVIATHDNADELRTNLPLILSQKYPSGYEVIVVDEASCNDTKDVLTLLKNEYSNLYTTFIPNSSHYLSRRKLALTLGVKAAKNEWIVFTDADYTPDSDLWLETIARKCNDSHDVVIGYTNYNSDTKSFYRFKHLLTALYSLRRAARKQAYRACGSNIAIRKSMFMKHNGFLKNLKYLRGEYDFIVNEYSAPGRAAIAMSPDSFLHQDTPTKKSWLNTGLYYMETRKHLDRSHGYRFQFNTDMLLLHLNYICDIAMLVVSLIMDNYIVSAASAMALLITVILRIVICRKTIKIFGEQISAVKIPFFELAIVWNNAMLMIRHRLSDRYDFIRK